MSDQAEGLRRWAEQRLVSGKPRERRVLMVVGEPERSAELPGLVLHTLRRWQACGQQWVGDPQRWRVVPLASDAEYLSALVSQQSRWGLWVDSDLDGLRRAYLTLRRLRAAGGPQRLLLVHPGAAANACLFDNLRQAAARFLDVQLMLVDEHAAEQAR